MPTTYAHWYFGKECKNTLSNDLQEIVNNNLDIFNIGVHGPDIFFYDLKHHDISEFGDDLHTIPAKGFFENCKTIYEKHEEKEAMLAYILGFLSHFTLDSTCHGYVERKKEVSGVSHNKIESEWDGHVIVKDGRFVNLVDRAESLRPNKKICKVISYFFPFDEKEVFRTCKAQQRLIRMLNYISPKRYRFFETLLHRIGKDNYADLLISPIEDVRCVDSNIRLDKLKDKALTIYPKLVKSFMSYLNNENSELDKYFEHDFGQLPDYETIPILNYEEEINYKVK